MAESITLGGGCFWCLDAAYRGIKGITEVVSGYAGGQTLEPTYEEVCRGTTGHAEVVRVSFDAKTIDLDTVLDIFFTLHDPTTLNRQGADVGTQYRSAIFYESPDQEAACRAATHRAAKVWDDPVVTELAPLQRFWPAEDYHQDYYNSYPDQGYCAAVISPKLAKMRAKWAHLLK